MIGAPVFEYSFLALAGHYSVSVTSPGLFISPGTVLPVLSLQDSVYFQPVELWGQINQLCFLMILSAYFA